MRWIDPMVNRPKTAKVYRPIAKRHKSVTLEKSKNNQVKT